MKTPEQIKLAIAELQDVILTAHPKLPFLLQEIRKFLLEDPDLVTLMTEEEIGIIISGLEKHTKTVITTAALKSTKKSLKSVTAADL